MTPSYVLLNDYDEILTTTRSEYKALLQARALIKSDTTSRVKIYKECFEIRYSGELVECGEDS